MFLTLLTILSVKTYESITLMFINLLCFHYFSPKTDRNPSVFNAFISFWLMSLFPVKKHTRGYFFDFSCFLSAAPEAEPSLTEWIWAEPGASRPGGRAEPEAKPSRAEPAAPEAEPSRRPRQAGRSWPPRKPSRAPGSSKKHDPCYRNGGWPRLPQLSDRSKFPSPYVFRR